MSLNFLRNNEMQVNFQSKTGQSKSELCNKDDQVYQKILQQNKRDEDVLVVSNGQVCYFNETFGQFSKRIQNKEVLTINVISLQATYTQMKDLEDFQKTYQLLQQEFRKVDEQLKQFQNTKEKFGTETIYTAYLESRDQSTLNQEDQNKLIRKLLEALGQAKKSQIEALKKTQQKQTLFSQQSLVTSVIETTCYQENCNLENSSISQAISSIQSCFFCQKYIGGITIFLNCSHAYHEDCLQSLFFSQLQLQIPILSCLCGYSQQQKTLQHFSDVNFGTLLKQKLLINQVKEIAKRYQIEKCKTVACSFYFILDNNIQKKVAYCPQCLLENCI
ncbi:unnamed protein product [Paramecium sonneborni]|uniref:RING-type domain-containing protein n=1 Tax=Paramecium sonneborni TaxID=65129 RepID=A0A8S1PZR2_9CILI|nr:unnamed protein product [Paramecium sonneborni]